MAVKTYGVVEYDATAQRFAITQAEPHVSIKLKSLFPRIPKTAVPPYHFAATPANCADLEWFMQRYPFQLSGFDLARIASGKQAYQENVARMETLLAPDYQAPAVALRAGERARDYQVQGSAFHQATQRLLLGDDLGLGKTLTAILSFLNPATLPAAVVVPTHMPQQWKEQVERFTNLRVHLIKGTQPYSLPEADVYVFKYSCLAGWVNFHDTGFFQSVVFDEVQELRHPTTDKYRAGRTLSLRCAYTLGLSATPIYNYGDEIFNVLDLLNPDALGSREDFLREWASPFGMHYTIRDPKALGSYLREQHLMLRRTRADVRRELPPINKIVLPIDFDQAEMDKSASLARQLALQFTTGSFVEKGQAAQQLDILIRQSTGVAKARPVARFVRMLLESGESVVLAGWHREVYGIWLEELADFNPVMYTGSETGKQKEAAKKVFVDGQTKLFIISLRSGSGLDGLQHICKTVVVGELDWSPQVHNQLIARVDRDGQPDQVTAYFPVCDTGSDQTIVNLLGLKSSQSHGIIDPLKEVAPQYSDESRIKLLAQQYLTPAEL